MPLQTVLGRVFGSVRLGWGSGAGAGAVTMLVVVGLSGVGVVGVGPVHAQDCDPVEIAKLLADDGVANDQFGRSVSIDGDTAVIGALLDDDLGDNSGSAFVYTRSEGGGGVWTQQAKLLADDGGFRDQSGYSVSIDGDTVVIGAIWEGDNGTGSAYVFVRDDGVWTQQAKLLAADGAALDQFGCSVSIDGDTAVIGALLDDDNGSNSGSAYVFARSGGVWTQQAKLLAADGAAFDKFGWSVSIDGDTAVIGAFEDDDNGDDSGSAFVFARSGGVWAQQAKLLAADGVAFDQFGLSVSIDSDTAVIGAHLDDDIGSDSGSAYVFTRSGGGGGVWAQQAKLRAADGAASDWFGLSVSIDSDTAVIGAHLDDDNGSASGSAYVFTRSGGVWTQQVKLLADDGAASDWFGLSVSIDGDTAVIGAFGDDDNGDDSGSAFVFDLGCADCPVDLNGDGIVDTRDFIVFLGAWSAGDPLADWDENGVVDTRDFIAYLADWSAGC